MNELDLDKIRKDAIARLDKRAAELRVLLSEPETHKLNWTPYEFGMKAKVGCGWLCVCRTPPPGYAGINYTSSMGPNSDDSYGGFLPGVTFDEALRLVYADYKRYTR